MKKAPYAFPLKSRAAIADFLARDGRAYDWRRYRFAWNVKAWAANFDGDSLRAHNLDLDPALDDAWDEHIEHDSNAFWRWCEAAARWVAEGDWCSYPGDDQGDWQFAFAGRSGGWLVLEKWRGRDMRDLDPAEFTDSEEWPFDDLRAFYRGIVCADSDFTHENAAREVEYFAADERAQWEEELRAAAKEAAEGVAAEIAAARPNLAPCYA